MDRGAWQATVYGFTKVSHDLATKQPPLSFIFSFCHFNYSLSWSFPCGSAGKESSFNVEDLGSIHALGRSPEEGKGYPLQYSGLENSMDCIVHGVAKNQTQLNNFH